MTPELFQEDLAEELQGLFKHYKLKNSLGTLKNLDVRTKNLPYRQGNDEEDEYDNNAPEPYLLIRASSGKVETAEDPQVVTVVIVICVFDDDDDRQGAQDILHIINVIYNRFATNPILASKYIFRYPFEWAIDDDSPQSYYFGGIQMQFEIPAIVKEDPFA